MKPIKVAMIGVGNCASSLVQGVAYYRQNNSSQGLIHDKIGGYGAGDVDFVLGIDVDARKVGKDIAEAIFASPNNTKVFQQDVPLTGAKLVFPGPALDGKSVYELIESERVSYAAGVPTVPGSTEPVTDPAVVNLELQDEGEVETARARGAAGIGLLAMAGAMLAGGGLVAAGWAC